MTFNSGNTVSRAEFSMMSTAVQQVSVQMHLIQSLFASIFKMNGQETKNGVLENTSSVGLHSAPVHAEPTMKKAPKKKKPPKKPTPEPMIVVTPVTVPAPVFEDEPLTLKEQEELTKAIPELSEDKLSAVIKIIQDAKPDLGDETEIDLDIDSLDNATQRKLQEFVDSCNPKKTKKRKTAVKDIVTSEPKPMPQTQPKDSFAFEKGDESDSDESVTNLETSNGFALNEDNDVDSDDDEGIANDWNFSKPESVAANDQGSSEEEDEDDAWKDARESAESKIALDEDRRMREEKMRAEAAAIKEKSRAEAAERAKKLQEERKVKAAEEARQREMKEKEERDRSQKAREQAVGESSGVTATVDMDEQRKIMEEYERSFLDKDVGGGESPSSDFGF